MFYMLYIIYIYYIYIYILYVARLFVGEATNGRQRSPHHQRGRVQPAEDGQRGVRVARSPASASSGCSAI